MRLALLLLTLSLPAAHGTAQTSRTLPSGLDTLEGNFWQAPGWSIQQGTGAMGAYLPARVDYCYQSNVFPWNPNSSKVITELRARLDSAFTGAVTAHRKEVAMWASVNGFDPDRPPMNFQHNATHGSNLRRIVNRQWINFLASQRSSPAPFDVVFKLSTPFVVPASSRNLVLQLNVYRADRSTAGLGWRVDSQEVQRSFDFGRSSKFGQSCPSSLDPFSFPTWGRGDLSTFVDTQLQARPVLAWIGARRGTPFQFPGTQCFLYVDPIVAQAGLTDRTGTRGRALFWWGRMPNIPGGTIFAHQYAVIQSGFPLFGSVGLSQGVETRVGTAWGGGPVPYSSIASFGSMMDPAPANPDTTRIGNWLNTRVVVWQVRP